MNIFDDIRKASIFDPSLKIEEKSEKLLVQKFLHPQKYSLKKLYDNMFEGRTIVFSDYPVSVKKLPCESILDTMVRLLKEGLPERNKINIRAGFSRTLHRITIGDTIDRWLRRRSKFGVTDLHFRNTKLYHAIDTDAVSHFNLLPHCPADVSFLEMLTLVISSKGIFTDSHSDDGDGSNHCFTGKKLWLAWDRTEGQKKGLQDGTVDEVYTQATFNMAVFASLKSAHWFTISEGQTLFMPGNFTHKVITLEPYIGFGSFYVSLPNYFNSFKRWLLYETGDVKGKFLETLNTYCIKRIKASLTSPAATRKKSGLHYFVKASSSWKKGLSGMQVLSLSENKNFKRLLDFASSLAVVAVYCKIPY